MPETAGRLRINVIVIIAKKMTRKTAMNEHDEGHRSRKAESVKGPWKFWTTSSVGSIVMHLQSLNTFQEEEYFIRRISLVFLFDKWLDFNGALALVEMASIQAPKWPTKCVSSTIFPARIRSIRFDCLLNLYFIRITRSSTFFLARFKLYNRSKTISASSNCPLTHTFTIAQLKNKYEYLY